MLPVWFWSSQVRRGHRGRCFLSAGGGTAGSAVTAAPSLTPSSRHVSQHRVNLVTQCAAAPPCGSFSPRPPANCVRCSGINEPLEEQMHGGRLAPAQVGRCLRCSPAQTATWPRARAKLMQADRRRCARPRLPPATFHPSLSCS